MLPISQLHPSAPATNFSAAERSELPGASRVFQTRWEQQPKPENCLTQILPGNGGNSKFRNLFFKGMVFVGDVDV